jgi:hypothetical protein
MHDERIGCEGKSLSTLCFHHAHGSGLWNTFWPAATTDPKSWALSCQPRCRAGTAEVPFNSSTTPVMAPVTTVTALDSPLRDTLALLRWRVPQSRQNLTRPLPAVQDAFRDVSLPWFRVPLGSLRAFTGSFGRNPDLRRGLVLGSVGRRANLRCTASFSPTKVRC